MKTVWLFALVLALASAPSEARPVKIASMVLGEGLQLGDGSGFYPDAAGAILRLWGREFSYDAVPFKRAVRDFEAGRTDCIWALDKNLLEDIGLRTERMIQSAALLVSSQRIFTRAEDEKIDSLQGLAGKKVGVLIGTNLQTELEPVRATVVELNSQETKVELLELGRLDAIIGWMPDLAITANLKQLAMPVFEKTSVIRVSEVAFVCHDNDLGRQFILEIDATVREYRASSAFEDLMVRYLGEHLYTFGS